MIPCVNSVEESQNVLSDDQVRSSSNPFVRIAKEGRKFGIGLTAITQRPSAISDDIRSQAENFFAFYMGNTDDIKALVRSNINYDGVVSAFVQRETIPGNLYFVTSSQPFVIPIRVVEFKNLSKEASQMKAASSRRGHDARALSLSPFARTLRSKLLALLRDQGFSIGPDHRLQFGGQAKGKIRAIHRHFHADRLTAETELSTIGFQPSPSILPRARKSALQK